LSQGAFLSACCLRSDGTDRYQSDRKKYGNDALNELVVLIVGMRSTDRVRMRLIGLTDAGLTQRDFKRLINALSKLESVSRTEYERETLQIIQVKGVSIFLILLLDHFSTL
jgi:hypothetical protein